MRKYYLIPIIFRLTTLVCLLYVVKTIALEQQLPMSITFPSLYVIVSSILILLIYREHYKSLSLILNTWEISEEKLEKELIDFIQIRYLYDTDLLIWVYRIFHYLYQNLQDNKIKYKYYKALNKKINYANPHAFSQIERDFRQLKEKKKEKALIKKTAIAYDKERILPDRARPLLRPFDSSDQT